MSPVDDSGDLSAVDIDKGRRSETTWNDLPNVGQCRLRFDHWPNLAVDLAIRATRRLGEPQERRGVCELKNDGARALERTLDRTNLLLGKKIQSRVERVRAARAIGLHTGNDAQPEQNNTSENG